jgi:hypothetical protein
MGCAIAADTKLETPEGPLTVKTVGNSPTAVMTRTATGLLRFAMTTAVRKIGEAQPVLRITLENGRAFRVAPEQRLVGRDDAELRAGDLKPGDALLNAFSFPVGYEYRTDSGETRVSDGCVAIAALAPAGEADLYALRVERTGRFVFSAGAIGLAES